MKGLRYEEEEDQNDFASMDDHDNVEEVQEAEEQEQAAEVIQGAEEEEEAEGDQEPEFDQEQAASIEEGEVQNFPENDFPEAEFDRSFTQEEDLAQSVPSRGARRRRDSDINNDRIPKRSRLPDQSSPAMTRSKSRDN